ncbi:MAG: N-acetyltransferase [Chloroflexota bacterium]|nr:MAG: N-acetyltransferase [Chloroflexota bacterium]
MAYPSRPYQSEADYALMRALLVEIAALEGPLTYYHLGDLDWWRFSANDPGEAVRQVRLWFDGERLVGFGWPSGSGIEFVAHPRHAPVEAEILAWGEGRRPADGEGRRFTAWSYEHHRARNQLLRSRGYERSAAHFRLNVRALDADPPAPALPAGYRIRHVRGEEDVAARVEVHRDAFSPSRMTVAKHLAVMSAPTYRPELDLVVEAPDGSFAAFCLVWHDAANRTGEFEPVGCHSAHRRLGLTRAVLFEGMRRLRALGATSCVVFSSGAAEAEPARRLYAAAGFELRARLYAWELQERGGGDA